MKSMGKQFVYLMSLWVSKRNYADLPTQKRERVQNSVVCFDSDIGRKTILLYAATNKAVEKV